MGVYCGLSLLIPLIGAFIVLVQGKREWVRQARWQPFLMGIAVICGHVFWMLVALAFIGVRQQALVILPDLIIFASGILWLILRPGLGPVILLIAFEAIVLIVNIITILPMAFASPDHKALTAHIALRIGAIAALVAGYRQFQKNQNNVSASQASTPGEQEQTFQIPPPLRHEE